MSARLLLRGAQIVSMDATVGDLALGDILIEGSSITAIAPRLDVTDAEIVSCAGMIAIPGFVDTHRHTWQSAVRHGYADMDPAQYFAEMLVGIGAAYTPEDVYAGTVLGAAAALSAGTTTLLDWAHIQNSPAHADAGIAALRDSGIRAVFAHGWPLVTDDRWTFHSELGHPSDIRRLREEYFASDDQLLTLAMAARGPEMTSPSVWQSDLRLARELGIRTTVHVGAYPHNAGHHAIAQYAAAGLLAADMTFVHCCRSHANELAMIADAGATVSLGVHCELNSQGIGDIPLDRMLALGLRPSLSGDTETKCSGDMFTQMRMLYAYHRSWMGGGHSQVPDASALRVRDVLEFATVQGARAVGMSERIGSLTPGKAADIVLVRADDLNLGPVADPVYSLVLAAHEGNVDTVLVGGRIVKRHGRLTGLITADLMAAARRSQQRILHRKSLAVKESH